MSHTDLGQPDLAALRAAARDAEAELASACGYPLADGADPLAPVARDLARSLTEAGFTMNTALGCAWLVTRRCRRGTGAGR